MTPVFEVSIWNLHELIRASVGTYNAYISEFWFRWPEGRSILRPHHYKAMGKCSYAVFSRKYKWKRAVDLKIWPAYIFDPMTHTPGHSRSYEVTFVFASNFWLRAGAVAPACLFENNGEKLVWGACRPWSRFCKAYISATTCPFEERFSFLGSHILSVACRTYLDRYGCWM